MKKVMMAAVLMGSSSLAMANAPGGPGCGWGNMLFEGQSGLPIHMLATIVNGTSGNATFGMTSGTNGCTTSVPLAYNGSSLLGMTGVMEEVAQDMATGEGEALTALSVSMGISAEDRTRFNVLMHQHFTQIFPHQDVTAEQVMNAITQVMSQDQQLAKYLAA